MFDVFGDWERSLMGLLSEVNEKGFMGMSWHKKRKKERVDLMWWDRKA